MTMFFFICAFLPYIISSSGSSAESSCFRENRSWSQNVILNIFESIPGHEECQHLCQDDLQCVAFTWTSSTNSEFQEGCTLFSVIGQPVSYNDSISGPRDCLCSEHYACTAEEDNLVEKIFGVMKEDDCREFCIKNSECEVYTW